MKVLHVIDKLNVGGAERVFINLSNMLFEKGIDVSTVSLLGKGELDSQLNCKIENLDFVRRSKFNFYSGYVFSKYLNKFDIVH